MMGLFSCFKPSTSVDPFEAETGIAITVSLREAEIQEAELLASAIQESSLLCQREEEQQKRRTRELENDAQIAHAFQYEEGERQIDDKSAVEDKEDEQLAKTLAESLKDKGKRKQFEEHVTKDKQIAQDIQNRFSKVAYEESSELHDNHVLDVKDEQLAKTVKNSLKAKGKEKQSEDEQVKKDEQFAVIVQESLNTVESPELEENKNTSTRVALDEDEQRIIWESLEGKGQLKQSTNEVEENGKLPKVKPPPSMCGGCNFEIEHGRSVDVLGVLWHPKCFCCDACEKPIAIGVVFNHVSNSRGKFHKSCYERFCYVCKEKKMKMYSEHRFWKERYCPAHETDGTPKCCSCERLEPRGTNYVMLGDGRWLCLECMDSAVIDTDQGASLQIEIREFFEGLNMKIQKVFPFLLVEKQALNKAEEKEKIDYQYEVVTRGICLSEAQTVTSVIKKQSTGPNTQLIEIDTVSQKVVRNCEVTAILILYGLPRLLTGYILAHEMMHAYLRLSGHGNLNKVLEEGICQVLGHMWLDSQRYAPIRIDDSAASSSASRIPGASVPKKGNWSDFEKKLVEFCKNQIETDDSLVYGVGFRKVNDMVTDIGLRETLRKITCG